MTAQAYDVAVVGAGVFGSWIAYTLRRAGKKVLLLDAAGPGNSLSSSGDESRIIRAGYGPDEVYSRMALDSLRAWQELFARQRFPQLFQKTGVLWMGRKDDPYMSASVQVLKRLGVNFEELAHDDLQNRFPQFDISGVGCAFLEPESGALMGRRAVQAVASAFVEEGGEVRIGKVRPLKTPKTLDSITLEDGETISAKTFVFACGPWLGRVFPDLLEERLFVTRQEVFYFAVPPVPDFRGEKMPIFLYMDDEVYGFPNLDNRGLKIAFDRHGESFDPDAGVRLVSPENLSKMRAYLARRFPAIAEYPVTEIRVCQYENTSNGDFLLDRHPSAENVWIAGGGSGHGFKHGPAIGKYMAGLIQGTVEPEPRFSLDTKDTSQKRAVF